ncbi:MAG: S26 family signal peptidase [Hyphomonadaceae bacterium]|nr:S26 family signal peptidase [Hyphomonadaceae bacterium]
MRISRFIPIGLGAVSIAALGVQSAVEFAPQFVWNASASAPIGLYKIEKRAPEIGDFVLVDPDENLQRLITGRGYLPSEIPLLKRVAALDGDEICRENEQVFINKFHAADALFVDSAGREMPVWGGCFTLQENELFLLNSSEKSLDGRYFGATNGSRIMGLATPVWVTSATPE